MRVDRGTGGDLIECRQFSALCWLSVGAWKRVSLGCCLLVRFVKKNVPPTGHYHVEKRGSLNIYAFIYLVYRYTAYQAPVKRYSSAGALLLLLLLFLRLYRTWYVSTDCFGAFARSSTTDITQKLQIYILRSTYIPT